MREARGDPRGGRSLSGLGIRPKLRTLGALVDLGVLGDLERVVDDGGGVEEGDETALRTDTAELSEEERPMFDIPD